MKEFKAESKLDLLVQIQEGFEDEDVYIPLMLGMDIVTTLLENGPNLKIICLPPSNYALVSERVKRSLQKARISLEVKNVENGRPKKYGDEHVREIIQLKNRGVGITQISRELGIPRRTIYYLLQD